MTDLSGPTGPDKPPQDSGGSHRNSTREPRLPAYAPAPEEVQQLIQRAREHPLGMDFLREGALDAVASVFGVHAFVVDSAREVIGDPDFAF